MLALTSPRGQEPWRSRLSLPSWTAWLQWLSTIFPQYLLSTYDASIPVPGQAHGDQGRQRARQSPCLKRNKKPTQTRSRGACSPRAKTTARHGDWVSSQPLKRSLGRKSQEFKALLG